MSYIDWIKSEFKRTGKKQNALARHLGLTHPQITRLLNGTRELKAREIPKIAEFFESDPPPSVSSEFSRQPDWLTINRDEHISSEDVAAGLPGSEHDETIAASTIENYSGKLPDAVPEIDARAGAGNGNVGEHAVVTLKRGESYVGHKVTAEWVFPSTFLRHELRLQPGGMMVLEVVGDSMSPTLESGDRVIIDTSHNRPTPDGIYVIEEGDGPMVKRLQLVRRSDPPEIRIISDNKNHEAYTLRLDDIRIVGRVSGRVSKM